MKHTVKCWTEFFDALENGSKTAEIRYNDRDYQKGDTLKIRAWHRLSGCFDSNKPSIYFEVTHILAGKPFLGDGYVMLSLRRLKSTEVTE